MAVNVLKQAFNFMPYYLFHS